ncbi:MAG: response regulator [Faecalibacterium sp.]|jgi:two-component system chemotaxis response regulator CheY|nr:response regulator [Faecalibacterium sp.]
MSKILVVDDAGFMRKMIQTYLRKAGYTDFVEGEDGAKAVQLYDTEKPDLVLMDITMPNVDGIEALRQIRTKDPKAKVVMCSAMGQESMVMEAIKLGALDFIVKPFKEDRIIQTVSKVLPL